MSRYRYNWNDHEAGNSVVSCTGDEKEEKKKEIGKVESSTAVEAGGGTMVKAILFRGIAVRDVHESLEISGVV
jgi:hypothetical protein